MTHERDAYMRRQEEDHDMIRMRRLPRLYQNTDPLMRKIALALWAVEGTAMRLLDEPAPPGCELSRQQTQCWKRARAVRAALGL